MFPEAKMLVVDLTKRTSHTEILPEKSSLTTWEGEALGLTCCTTTSSLPWIRFRRKTRSSSRSVLHRDSIPLTVPRWSSPPNHL